MNILSIGSRLWWFGDWCNFGERKYGEKYSQALEASDYERSTLRQASWVARQIEMSRRLDNLSWSHHLEVAALEPEDQDRWLNRADKEQLSSRDLRGLVRAERIERETPPLPEGKYRVIYADPPWKYGDTREGLEGWQGTAAEGRAGGTAMTRTRPPLPGRHSVNAKVRGDLSSEVAQVAGRRRGLRGRESSR